MASSYLPGMVAQQHVVFGRRSGMLLYILAVAVSEPRAHSRWRLVRRRVVAYLLDVGLLFAVLAPLGFAVQWILGYAPSTGPQIWATLLLNFSLPAWAYFAASDASAGGATVGKRWVGIRVSPEDHGRVGAVRAVGRTAVKLAPWELVHVSAFGLSQGADQFSVAQGVGLTAANLLAIAYVAWAIATGGHRSVHDVVAGTVVGDAA